MQRRFQRQEMVWSSLVGDRAVLYSWDDGRAIVLNPTGAALWDALASPRTASELGAILVARFSGLSPERARTDAEAYVERLLGENVLRAAP